MGKARGFSDDANDTVYQSETNSENYAMGSQQNPYNLGSVHFSDQSGIGNFSQAGTDQRKANIKGALFQGNIGFDLQTALLDTGTETIDLNNDSTGAVLSVISTDRFVTLDSGTTGTLTTITGPQRPGQRLRLYNTTINTITITHTAAATVDTIRTPNATNLSFPGNGVLDLSWDITSAQWRVVGNVGGSGGVSFPIDFPEIDLGNVSGTVDIDWALSTRHAIKFTMIGNTTLTFSGTTSDTTEYSNLIAVQDGTGGWTLTLPVGTINASIVEAGILLDPNTETGIVVKFSFSTFYAFLETGNIVTGGIDLLSSNNVWTGTNTFENTVSITASNMFFGDEITDTISFGGRIDNNGIIPINNSASNLGASGNQWNTLWIDTLDNASTVVINSPNFTINSSQITLGDQITDEVTFLGRIGSNAIIPITDSTTDLGTNVLRWDNIYSINVIANTITSSVSLSSTGNTFLGDDATDNISFGGQVNTNIVIEEISEPSNAPTDTGRFYAKESGGVSVPFWKDEAGTETSMIGAASGANTALSNLASVAINTSLLPNANGTIDLGSASFSWENVYSEEYRIEDGGAVGDKTSIVTQSSGVVYNTTSDDDHQFYIGGDALGIGIEEDRIQFLTSGRQHRIDVTATSINILSQNVADSVEIWTGTGRTNATIDVNSETTTFLTQTGDTQAILIQLIQNNNTPANSRTIGNIDFMAENTVSSNEIYARVSASSQDVTSTTEDGLLQLGVISGGTLVSGIDIEGSGSGGANDALIGFFGETPVVQQQLDVSPTTTEISTVLRNLGLTHL